MSAAATRPQSGFFDDAERNTNSLLPDRQSSLNSADELLLVATDRFCHAGTYNRLTLEEYKEAFFGLVEKVSGATKQIICRSLADSSFTPQSIALHLAMEPLLISTPMLTRSTALGQLDMQQVINKKGVAYARILSSRPDIGQSLVTRLRQLDDEMVNQRLDRNEAIAPQTTGVPTMQDQKPIQQPQEHTGEESTFSAREKLMEAAARGGRLEQTTTQQAPSSNDEGYVRIADFGSALLTAATAGSGQGMAILMQKHASLSLETAYQVLEDDTGDTLAVLLKASDIDPALANRIQMLTFPSIGLSVQNAMRAIEFYKTLQTGSCQEAVAQWPKEEMLAPAHQPYLEEGSPVRGAPQSDTGRPAEDQISTTRRAAS